MSSFMVNEKTINKILSYLEYDTSISSSYRKQILKAVGFDLTGENEEYNKLGCALIKLNKEAFNNRYKKKEEVKDVYIYVHTSTTIIQALKSLQCLLYQCSE